MHKPHRSTADQAVIDAQDAANNAATAVSDAPAAQGTADQAVIDAQDTATNAATAVSDAQAAAQGTADQAVIDPDCRNSIFNIYCQHTIIGYRFRWFLFYYIRW